ncbi:MAG: hypothetical protein MJ238_01280 [Bacilli bacterium]|nr:hypothetical protein [Bacilli bacterium]
MLQKFELFLPRSKRKVRITVSIPRNYNNSGIVYDSLYMLDGQNIFKNHEAAFGRSLHMGRYLGVMANNFDKHICGIAISNAGSDLGRINEYMPWKLEALAEKHWEEQDLEVCKSYTYDLLHTVIPYIQERFPVSKDKDHTYIMGSSLGALYACYLGNAYPQSFGAVGSFSNCPFLAPIAFQNFMESHLNPELRNFHYVGMRESSDGMFDENAYFNETKKLHEYLKSQGVKSKLVVDVNGVHNEETWEKHVLDFLSFVYFDDIDITL